MRTDLLCGADISTLPDTEAEGGVFFTDGRETTLLDALRNHGIRSVRLRVWHDPYTADGTPYGGGTCDTEKMLRLAKRAQDAGFSILLDFHYSDFWCDPARQGTPKAWQKLRLPEMADALHQYTAETLERFTGAGIRLHSVQVGNEITNGMLWETAKLDRTSPDSFVRSFARLAELLRAGIAAVRSHSDAKIVLHLENSGNNALWREWFDAASAERLDFDIIGASYYPLWHGSLTALRANAEDMIARYDKEFQIVETAYPFTTEPFAADGKRFMIAEDFTLPDGSKPRYPFTKEGQAAFTGALLETVSQIPRCTGVYWWEPGWLPLATSTWATKAALAEIGEAEKDTGNEWANQCLFDYSGNANPALDTFRRFAMR